MEISYSAKEGGSRSWLVFGWFLAGFWLADREAVGGQAQRWLPSSARPAAAVEPLPHRREGAGCSRCTEERQQSAGFSALLIYKREAIHCLKGFLMHGCDFPGAQALPPAPHGRVPQCAGTAAHARFKPWIEALPEPGALLPKHPRTCYSCCWRTRRGGAPSPPPHRHQLLSLPPSLPPSPRRRSGRAAEQLVPTAPARSRAPLPPEHPHRPLPMRRGGFPLSKAPGGALPARPPASVPVRSGRDRGNRGVAATSGAGLEPGSAAASRAPCWRPAVLQRCSARAGPPSPARPCLPRPCLPRPCLPRPCPSSLSRKSRFPRHL